MTSNEIKNDISEFIKGDILIDDETLDKYSHDASLFEVRPKIVVFPKDREDVRSLIDYINTIHRISTDH